MAQHQTSAAQDQHWLFLQPPTCPHLAVQEQCAMVPIVGEVCRPTCSRLVICETCREMARPVSKSLKFPTSAIRSYGQTFNLLAASAFVVFLVAPAAATAQAGCVSFFDNHGRTWISNGCSYPIVVKWRTPQGSCRTGCVEDLQSIAREPTATLSGDGSIRFWVCWLQDYLRNDCFLPS